MSQSEENGEGFLSRWSRRKLSEDPVTDEVVDVDALQAPAITDEESLDVAEQPLLTDADMPPLESLSEDSDYSGFMSSGVSEELRQLALRQLFRSAVFNERDGLDDYDEDFTSFEKLGEIVTSDMRFQIEREQEKLRQQELALQEEAIPQDTVAVDEEHPEEPHADEMPIDAVEDVETSLDKHATNTENKSGEDI